MVLHSGMFAALRRCMAASAVLSSATSWSNRTVALWIWGPLKASPTTPHASPGWALWLQGNRHPVRERSRETTSHPNKLLQQQKQVSKQINILVVLKATHSWKTNHGPRILAIFLLPLATFHEEKLPHPLAGIKCKSTFQIHAKFSSSLCLSSAIPSKWSGNWRQAKVLHCHTSDQGSSQSWLRIHIALSLPGWPGHTGFTASLLCFISNGLIQSQLLAKAMAQLLCISCKNNAGAPTESRPTLACGEPAAMFAQDTPERVYQHPWVRQHKGLSLCSSTAGTTGAQTVLQGSWPREGV